MTMLSKSRGIIAVFSGLSLMYVFLMLSGFSPLRTVHFMVRKTPEEESLSAAGHSNISNISTTSHPTKSMATSIKPTMAIATKPPSAMTGPRSAFTSSSTTSARHYVQRETLQKQHVAIIVPYRDREIHLKIFTHYMTTFLRQQNSSASIYIAEQAGNGKFNRAKLFNVGYVEAKKDGPFDCFIFHDIDLIPENRKLSYTCGVHPKHMSAAIDKYKYRLPYRSIFGGVSALSEAHMKKTNGFSNMYWGWGGEDDDMYSRVAAHDKLERPPMALARYTMLQNTGRHVRSQANPERFALLKNVRERMPKDGISTLKYTLVEKKNMGTYTWVLADLSDIVKTTIKPTTKTPTSITKEPRAPNSEIVAIIKMKAKTVNDNATCMTLQKKRKDLIETVCKGQVGKYPNTNLKSWKNRPNVIVLEKERAVYCFITDAGATEWKYKILAHRGVTKAGQFNGTDLIEADEAIQSTLVKYNAKLLNSYTEDEQVTILKNFYKFAFFTNPYQRIYKSYSVKLMNPSNSSYRPMALRILKDLGVTNVTVPSFAHFLMTMAETGSSDLHWMRFGELCSPCQVGYDFIGQMETLASDVACLLPHLEMTSWFPVPTATAQRNALAKAAKIYSALPKDLLQKVEKIYGMDAKLFDYSIPSLTFS